MPLVSVVIPTYNRQPILLGAIKSVLNQTFQDFEVLVVDDGSSDNTEKIVADIKDPRVRCLHHRVSKGASAARNTGISAASGKLIAFLDDDDEWHTQKLEKQIPVLESYDAALCVSLADGYPARLHKFSGITLEDLRRGSFHPSGLIAKSFVLKDIMFDEELRQGEDWDLLIRIAKRYRIGWLRDPLVYYSRGDHERITNEKKHLTSHELEMRATMLYKHRAFFGEKWFKYHIANALLAYIWERPRKLYAMHYAVKKCGVAPVVRNLIMRILKRTRRFLIRRKSITGNNK